MVISHNPDCDCIICKARSLSVRHDHPNHVKKGDPWEGNPVAERIKELQEEGAKLV